MAPEPASRSGGLATFHAVAWASVSLFVLWWTLLPFAPDLSPDSLTYALADVQWVPFIERGRPPLWSDVLGNLALFAPFGFAGWRFLDGRRGRLALVLASAATLSLAVELVQLALPARRTSATDLVTDALGAAVGAGLGRIWENWGRHPVRAWLSDLARGENAHVLVAAFAVGLTVWALAPGSSPAGDLWRQIQSFSSSFRRFPGWEGWVANSFHSFLLGWLFATLFSRSWRGNRAAQAAFGVFATILSGVALETIQLLAPSRRPEIYQALAFGIGGLPGSVAGLCPRPVALAVIVAVLGAGLAAAPAGDNPAAVTRTILLIGVVLAGWGGWATTRPSERRWVSGARGES